MFRVERWENDMVAVRCTSCIAVVSLTRDPLPPDVRVQLFVENLVAKVADHRCSAEPEPRKSESFGSPAIERIQGADGRWRWHVTSPRGDAHFYGERLDQLVVEMRRVLS